jgi:predicted O-methyltransferase YrrM
MSASLSNRQIHDLIRGVPHMTLEQADRMRRLIVEERLNDILELGFFHGVSTCYMAHALAEIGGGRITTIDLESARDLVPGIETLLEKVGQRDRVDVHYEPTSYTWRLMKMLEEDPSPRFDLCYLDGAHNWFVDGFAFFLVDRLLKPGGWIVFDDLDWTYAKSPALRDTDMVRNMPADERETPQVRKVYELLAKPHPDYHHFREERDWAFIQKRPDATRAAPIRTEVVVREVGLGTMLARGVRKLRGR